MCRSCSFPLLAHRWRLPGALPAGTVPVPGARGSPQPSKRTALRIRRWSGSCHSLTLRKVFEHTISPPPSVLQRGGLSWRHRTSALTSTLSDSERATPTSASRIDFPGPAPPIRWCQTSQPAFRPKVTRMGAPRAQSHPAGHTAPLGACFSHFFLSPLPHLLPQHVSHPVARPSMPPVQADLGAATKGMGGPN